MARITGSTIISDGNYNHAEPSGFRKFHFRVSGTFGGGTVKLQWSDDNTVWVDYGGDATATAAATAEVIGATYMRVNVAGSSAPSLNVFLDEVFLGS